jgi:hypothetical protein
MAAALNEQVPRARPQLARIGLSVTASYCVHVR